MATEMRELHYALTVDEATKYGETWVGFPYNRDLTREEIEEARRIKKEWVEKMLNEEMLSK